MMTGKTNKTSNWRWLTAVSLCLSLVGGILISEKANAQTITKRESATSKSTLDLYTTDLTSLAAQDRFNSVDVPRDLTNKALQILASENRNNPVVISESQAVRDVIAIGVARRLVAGDVPDSLSGKRLFKLNLEKLFRDSTTVDELQTNLSAILSEIAGSDHKGILIVDPVQALVGSSAAFDGAASSLLLDAIKKGDVHCLGETTEIIYQENVAKEESLA